MTECIHSETMSIITNFHIPRWHELPSIDLYMDQVVSFVDGCLGEFFREIKCSPLTKSMVNNYVKAKIVSAPVNKKYSRLALAMIIVVYILKTCYSTDEVGKLIKMGISLKDTEKTYDRFCTSIEEAIREVFAGEVHITNENVEGRERKYLMENFALSFASKFYVQKVFIYGEKL